MIVNIKEDRIMELRDLQIFQSVADQGSVSSAAKELNYVQSNVTTRIKQLENELKTPLFIVINEA